MTNKPKLTAEPSDELLQALERDKARRAADEPLQPDPAWQRQRNAPFDFVHSHTPARRLRDFPPAAYAQGFSDGAYALATLLYKKLLARDMDGLFQQLHDYQTGQARPIRDWQNETR